ncbi:HAD family hydrolase [Leptospira sp. 96542]|nr:HAD family hydrolase [Leptospira sp. 96542]
MKKIKKEIVLVNFKFHSMNKALFLDRDGIINEDFDYVFRKEDFKFKSGIFELCRKANEKGFHIFVITNQAGIARGYYSERDFFKLTRWMVEEFKNHNCQITKVYFCPYHPDHGNSKYKRVSNFRKPSPGMISKAVKRYHIDLKNSILIGDQRTDVEAGIAAGVGQNLLLLNKKKDNQLVPSEATIISDLSQALDYLA